jgi:predicted PurR-regulated permease PerM
MTAPYDNVAKRHVRADGSCSGCGDRCAGWGAPCRTSLEPDSSLLWDDLIYFLSYVRFIGLELAVMLAILLALAEIAPEGTIVVIVGLVVINTLAENVLSPTLIGRGLNLSPTIVFLPFIFWAWLLGGSGAFLALPLTLFVATMLETSPETRRIGQPHGIARHRGERSSRRGLACGS